MKILGERLLVKIIRTTGRFESLYLPERKKTQEAVVISVGDELEGKFSPGDRIIWDVYKGIPVGGKDEMILNLDGVLAKIES